MDKNDKMRKLKEAMRTETDVRTRSRMMAVLGVLRGHSTGTASDFADVDRRTVQLWVSRFNEDGVDGLRDSPGRGRDPRVRYAYISRLADRLGGRDMLTPRKLRNQIRTRLGCRYSLCSVRRILRVLGFSPKRSVTEYASAADDETVRRWQADAAGTIRHARRRGFAVVVQDESVFVRIGTNGKKMWSRVGDPVTLRPRD